MRMHPARKVVYVMGAAALSLLACHDRVTGPVEDAPTPGWLPVALVNASPRAAGAIIVRVSGDSILDVRASSPYTLVARGRQSTAARVLVVGAISNGPLFEIRSPDTRQRARYVLTVDQVADDSTYAQRDPSDFSVRIPTP